MSMKGRSWQSEKYRYGFNGQEKDTETGTSNFKFREYNDRSGRFWSVDPLAAQYPWNSPYAFAENRVIDGIDLEGLEHYYTTDGLYIGHVKNQDKIINSSVLALKQTQAGLLDNNLERIHKVAQGDQKGLTIFFKLALNHEQILDRANWIVAEGQGYFAEHYAHTMQNMSEKVGSEKLLYEYGMQDQVNGKTVHLDKDAYLKGELHNKSGASFYQKRDKPNERTQGEWLAVEAVIGSLAAEADPTNGTNNWRGGKGTGAMQGAGGGGVHRFLVYGKSYSGNAPMIPAEFAMPNSVNYDRLHPKKPVPTWHTPMVPTQVKRPDTVRKGIEIKFKQTPMIKPLNKQ